MSERHPILARLDAMKREFTEGQTWIAQIVPEEEVQSAVADIEKLLAEPVVVWVGCMYDGLSTEDEPYRSFPINAFANVGDANGWRADNWQRRALTRLEVKR